MGKVEKAAKKLIRGGHDFIFKRIHNRNLIYNACWEDPRLDRRMLNLDRDSEVVMITSAGCNALDYLLDQPRAIHAIDVNPRQNALLELKLAMFDRGDFDDLFKMFGFGRLEGVKKTIYKELRSTLSERARVFWDKKIYYFTGTKLRKSFYYHGAAGKVAWLTKNLFKSKKSIRRGVKALLAASDLDEQRAVYEEMEKRLWSFISEALTRHPLFLAMLGVPRPQIMLINNGCEGGVLGFIQDRMRHVFTELPISDNYFWRVYLEGAYLPETCCPNYLKKGNFEIIRKRRKAIRPHTTTITQYLKENPGVYSHYVLLDHQDWLAWHAPAILEEEWEEILKNSRIGTKILMRTAGFDVDFLPENARKSVRFHPEIADAQHVLDRVGTYGRTVLAEVI